jgi:hypothetical protein
MEIRHVFRRVIGKLSDVFCTPTYFVPKNTRPSIMWKMLNDMREVE